MKLINQRFARLVGAALNSGHLIRASHWPQAGQGFDPLFVSEETDASAVGWDGLPLPPAKLRMGYGGDIPYQDHARETIRNLKQILIENDVEISPGGSILDWGCASGRVIRGFVDQSQNLDIWGVDQDAACISWAKKNLSPPFRFVTCTCWPSLGFPDEKFDLVYGISVFTHLSDLVDSWLLELARILKPGGYLLVSIHDQSSIDFFEERSRLPFWMPQGTDLCEIRGQERVVFGSGGWSKVFTVFRSDWFLKECEQFYSIVEVKPRFERSQTGVLLRKK